MSYNYLPYAQDQMLLLPPSLKDWVPVKSLPHFISDLIDRLDAEGRLQKIYAVIVRMAGAAPHTTRP